MVRRRGTALKRKLSTYSASQPQQLWVSSIPFRNGAPDVKPRFLCMSGSEARTRQVSPGAGGEGRGVHAGSGVGVWPRQGPCSSGFVQGLVSLFPGRSASRPPPGIFLPSVVGSSAAYMMLVQSGPRVSI